MSTRAIASGDLGMEILIFGSWLGLGAEQLSYVKTGTAVTIVTYDKKHNYIRHLGMNA